MYKGLPKELSEQERAQWHAVWRKGALQKYSGKTVPGFRGGVKAADIIAAGGAVNADKDLAKLELQFLNAVTEIHRTSFITKCGIDKHGAAEIIFPNGRYRFMTDGLTPGFIYLLKQIFAEANEFIKML